MRKSKAFTLIELLVVIAIIALLLSILMPSLRKVQMSAKSVVCASHLKTWSKAFLMYTNENNNNFPGIMEGSGGLYGRWTIALKPYYGNETKIWFCPMARKPFTQNAKDPFAAWVVDETMAGDLRPGDYGSYGINAWVYNGTSGYTGFSEAYSWKNTFAATPNNVPVFGDCMWRGGFPEDDDTPQPNMDDRLKNDAESMRYFNMNRHNGATNLIFMDFSYRKVPLKQLWRLKWSKNFNTGRQFPPWPDWMANLSSD